MEWHEKISKAAMPNVRVNHCCAVVIAACAALAGYRAHALGASPCCAYPVAVIMQSSAAQCRSSTSSPRSSLQIPLAQYHLGRSRSWWRLKLWWGRWVFSCSNVQTPLNRHRQEMSLGEYHCSCVPQPPLLWLATGIGVTQQGGFQVAQMVSGCPQVLPSHWQVENMTSRSMLQRCCTSEYCPQGLCPLVPHPCQQCKGWTVLTILWS